MLRHLLMVLTALLLMVPSVQAEPLSVRDLSEAEDRFAANPRAVKDIGDPFVLKTEDGYQMFATGGPIGFFTWKSNDLVKFERTKALKKVSWAASDYWAPEVFAWQGKYVMLFTARQRSTGSLRTGIAFSDTPEGEYKDPLDAPLMDYGYATIDATLTTDAEGNPYLIYVRDISENRIGSGGESHIYGVRLADDLLSTVGDPVLLLTPQGEWESRSGSERWNEGPTVLEHDGKWYLFYSANGYFMKEYSVCVAVADHPLGPYTKQSNNPLLAPVEKEGEVLISGPGHNAFFCVGDELFTAYHIHTYPNAPSGNRQLCLDRAGFHTDGTAYISGPTLEKQLRPLAEMGLKNHMKEAVCTAEHADLLCDGDTCTAAASADYVFRGTDVTMTWASPVRSDMLLIYPAAGEAIAGTVTINGLEADFACEASLTGGAAVLFFEAMDVQELTVTLTEGSGIGEIMLIGPEA